MHLPSCKRLTSQPAPHPASPQHRALSLLPGTSIPKLLAPASLCLLPISLPPPSPPGGPHGWGWGTGRAPGCAVSLTPFSSPHGGLESRNKTRREWHAQFCSRPTSACSVLTSTPRCRAETHRSEESCELPPPRPPLIPNSSSGAAGRQRSAGISRAGGRAQRAAPRARATCRTGTGFGEKRRRPSPRPLHRNAELPPAPLPIPPRPGSEPPERRKEAKKAENAAKAARPAPGGTEGAQRHGDAKTSGGGGGKPQGSASARRSAFPAAALAHRAQHAVPRGEAKRCTSRTCTPPNPPAMVRNCPRRRNRGGREHQPRGAARCFVPRERQRMRRSASPPDGRSPAQRLRGRGRRERGENKARNEAQRAPLIAREGRERGGFRGLPPGRATCGTRERHGRALRPQCKQQSRGRVPLLNPRVSQLRAAPTPRHRSAPTGGQRCSP